MFAELPPLEKVATVEVIHVNRKKKVWNYNYDDENDTPYGHYQIWTYQKFSLTWKVKFVWRGIKSFSGNW